MHIFTFGQDELNILFADLNLEHSNHDMQAHSESSRKENQLSAGTSVIKVGLDNSDCILILVIKIVIASANNAVKIYTHIT